ncbi:MAG: hypothetical protein ACREPE_04665 [Lysobacter sp.]
MKLRHASAIAILLLASPGIALAGDTWMVKNIARHTGISTEEVVAVLGDRMDLTECEYARHPSRRTSIQRLVVARHDAMVAAQSDRRRPAKPESGGIAAIDR